MSNKKSCNSPNSRYIFNINFLQKLVGKSKSDLHIFCDPLLSLKHCLPWIIWKLKQRRTNTQRLIKTKVENVRFFSTKLSGFWLTKLHKNNFNDQSIIMYMKYYVIIKLAKICVEPLLLILSEFKRID